MTITETIYLEYKKLKNELEKLVIEKANEISIMKYNHGVFENDYKFDEYYEEKDQIHVQFEKYECGDVDYNVYTFPIEFLWDSNILEKIKNEFEEEKRKIEEERKKKEQERNERYEIFERNEYERLRKKYEI